MYFLYTCVGIYIFFILTQNRKVWWQWVENEVNVFHTFVENNQFSWARIFENIINFNSLHMLSFV